MTQIKTHCGGRSVRWITMIHIKMVFHSGMGYKPLQGCESSHTSFTWSQTAALKTSHSHTYAHAHTQGHWGFKGKDRMCNPPNVHRAVVYALQVTTCNNVSSGKEKHSASGRQILPRKLPPGHTGLLLNWFLFLYLGGGWRLCLL